LKSGPFGFGCGCGYSSFAENKFSCLCLDI
jgi:hypothetical protein